MATLQTNILFLDVVGWSGLESEQIESYVTRALPKINDILKEAEFKNTWGDAVVAAFNQPAQAAKAALRIRDMFVRGEEGIAKGLAARIALHNGMVMVLPNAITENQKDIFGTAVHLAARLEPVTQSGRVYCTARFASLLKDVADTSIKTTFVRAVALPKNFGSEAAHEVSWIGETALSPMRDLIDNLDLVDVWPETTTQTEVTYKTKLRMVIINNTYNDIYVKAIKEWRPVEVHIQPNEEGRVTSSLQLESERGWKSGGWQAESSEAHVPRSKAFRVWIGLDPTWTTADIRRFHEKRRLGVVVLPVSLQGYDGALELKV